MLRWLLLALLIGWVAPALAQTAMPAEPPAAAKPPAAKPAAKPAARPAAKTAAKKPEAAAPAAPAQPLSAEDASRLAYRARLTANLTRAQTTLGQQQTELASQQNKLKQLYSAMIEAVSKSETDPAAPAAGGAAAGPGGKKDPPPAVKASVSYEAQTYQVQVARAAVLTTQKEIGRLQGFLTHIQQ